MPRGIAEVWWLVRGGVGVLAGPKPRRPGPGLTAMSRLQARTLARDEVLAAVTGNAASLEGADGAVPTRLQVA
jgi:hypothetical protein